MKTLITLTLCALVALAGGCAKSDPSGDTGGAVTPAQRAGDPGMAEDGPRQAFIEESRETLADLRRRLQVIENLAAYGSHDQIISECRFLGREVATAQMQVNALETASRESAPKRQEDLERTVFDLKARVAELTKSAESLKPPRPRELPDLGDAPTTVPAVPK